MDTIWVSMVCCPTCLNLNAPPSGGATRGISVPIDVDYNNLIELHPKVAAVLPEKVLAYMKGADKKTFDHLTPLWKKNINTNVKKHIPKWGWINEGFLGFGHGKAVIAVGSGSSLNKNKDLLKMICMVDGVKRLENQEFIVMASNHQIKDCLEMGIIPHFAMVADGSENLVKQMDVGDLGRHTILIATVTTHPKVIAKWPGPVRFVAQQNAVVRGFLKDAGMEMPKESCVVEGGNILNLSFILSIGLFQAPVWMCVGNDLSFPALDTVEDRRDSYYADGVYDTNLKSKRDEARNKFSWAGLEFQNDQFGLGNYVNLNVVNTSPQLFIYKSWLESNSLILWDIGQKFKLYNCTEGGILGVNVREGVTDYDGKFDAKNWCLLDELTGNNWRTRKLSDAVEEFHIAKTQLEGNRIWQPGETKSVVQNAMDSDHRIIH